MSYIVLALLNLLCVVWNSAGAYQAISQTRNAKALCLSCIAALNTVATMLLFLRAVA